MERHGAEEAIIDIECHLQGQERKDSDKEQQVTKSNGKITAGSYRAQVPDGRIQIVTYTSNSYGYTARCLRLLCSSPEDSRNRFPSSSIYKTPTTPVPVQPAPIYKTPATVYPTPAYETPLFQTSGHQRSGLQHPSARGS
ncbi:uncharacterized protein LOC130700873 [Daphnia carinata]|uniref:uncharacterized protein LOC130700873 n=1 Tax=Daphnia carinata TaxID=120202 RepID=UPI00257BC25D|nr:uncharacterized protein LOC130700873 [Daphnia carinata]